MSQLGFIFDLNKCVGCQACHIACSIENDLGYDFNWREINTYNPEQIDAMPHYHLSLACNHCQKPICLYQCPAKAISKNPDTGIVIIEEDKCIGCKFCSWVCPYDAPKYNSTLNVMTKCTLCLHRIEENLEPACVSICPTDALNTTYQTDFKNAIVIAGFPQSEIKPSIQIEPLNSNQKLPEQYTLPYAKKIIDQYSRNRPQPKQKISLTNDWTLVIFTLSISILGGLMSASLFSDDLINPKIFVFIGLVGMGFSTLHLGKKNRAYRVLLNWKTSWLSREILFFSGFMFLSSVYLFLPEIKWVGYIALILGLLSAISADNVYHVIVKTNKKFFNSDQVWITLILFICFFNQFLLGVLFIGIIKITLYLQQKWDKNDKYFLTFVRLTSFITAIIFLIQNYFNYALILLIISELVGRVEFYLNLHIITPKIHMALKFKEDLKSL
jgi:DMSO reductase iron-sulfur subunit